jgi:hypothetical protein
MRKRSSKISNIKDIISSRSFLFGIKPDNLYILNDAWEKEMSGFKNYFDLAAVEKNVLIINARTSVAANEVRIRKHEIIRSINKYFKNKWIKDVKVFVRNF